MVPYKYTSLTCVHYVPGDKLGKLLAYSSLLPVLIIVFQSAKVYCRREVHQAFLLLGMALSEAVNRTLKNTIQQSRPPLTCAALNVCHSHGMPSSHSQFMFFTLVTGYLVSIRRSPARNALAQALQAIEVLVLATLSVVVAASRVYLGYHTVQQVVAGSCLGVVLGAVWTLVMYRLPGVYDSVARWQVCQLLDVRNTWGAGKAKRA